MDLRPHPAKYSASVLLKFDELIDTGRLLDPFAGVGGIHDLASESRDTVGVELEPEWAAHHCRTMVGDATSLPFGDDSFDAVATSPAYGNRLADSYAGESCKDCLGQGKHLIGWDMNDSAPAPIYNEEHPCPTCLGSRHKPTRRFTYRLSLGRDLTERNGGSMQWGPAYRWLHEGAISEMARVVKPGGVVLINMKDHIRGGKRQFVADWWLRTCQRAGLRFVEGHTVSTPGIGMGANREARVKGEQVIVMEVV